MSEPTTKISIVEFTAMGLPAQLDDHNSQMTFLNKDDSQIKISLKHRFPTVVIHSITEYQVIQQETRVINQKFEPNTGIAKQFIKQDAAAEQRAGEPTENITEAPRAPEPETDRAEQSPNT